MLDGVARGFLGDAVKLHALFLGERRQLRRHCHQANDVENRLQLFSQLGQSRREPARGQIHRGEEPGEIPDLVNAGIDLQD